MRDAINKRRSDPVIIRSVRRPFGPHCRVNVFKPIGVNRVFFFFFLEGANCKISVLFVTKKMFSRSVRNYFTLAIMKAHSIS